MKNNAMMTPSGTIRDDMLVLNLPDAINPTVWQFDLARARSSAIEVSADQNNYRLRLKTVEGDVHEIALYPSREAAITALSIAHQALANKSKTISRRVVTDMDQEGTKNHWPLAIAAFIIFVTLTVILFGSSTTTTNTSHITSQELPQGVPLSADDVLKGRMP